MRVINALALATLLLATAGGTSMAQDKSADATPSVAVARSTTPPTFMSRPGTWTASATVSSRRSAVPSLNKLS